VKEVFPGMNRLSLYTRICLTYVHGIFTRWAHDESNCDHLLWISFKPAAAPELLLIVPLLKSLLNVMSTFILQVNEGIHTNKCCQ